MLTLREVDRRLRALYSDRAAVLNRYLAERGELPPKRHPLMRHLEREIDWYEAKESAAWRTDARAAHAKTMRSIRATLRRAATLLGKESE